MKIGLLSDTHGFIDDNTLRHLDHCEEIWHAGDFGSQDVIDKIRETGRPLRGVYGNIDAPAIRHQFPEQIVFEIENVKVMMRHIAGSPPKYNAETKKQLLIVQPGILVCGHSHILKIMFDEAMQCLFINPGAAGKQGWHKVRTLVRFEITGSDIKNAEVIELKK